MIHIIRKYFLILDIKNDNSKNYNDFNFLIKCHIEKKNLLKCHVIFGCSSFLNGLSSNLHSFFWSSFFYCRWGSHSQRGRVGLFHNLPLVHCHKKISANGITLIVFCPWTLVSKWILPAIQFTVNIHTWRVPIEFNLQKSFKWAGGFTPSRKTSFWERKCHLNIWNKITFKTHLKKSIPFCQNLSS